LCDRSKPGDEAIAGFGMIVAVTEAGEKWLRAHGRMN